jgi:hypothetical protein
VGGPRRRPSSDVVPSEGCPCPFCLRRTSDCGEDFERRVAALPSPQHYHVLMKVQINFVHIKLLPYHFFLILRYISLFNAQRTRPPLAFTERRLDMRCRWQYTRTVAVLHYLLRCRGMRPINETPPRTASASGEWKGRVWPARRQIKPHNGHATTRQFFL